MQSHATAVPMARRAQEIVAAHIALCGRGGKETAVPILSSTLQAALRQSFNGVLFMRVRSSIFLAILAVGLSALSARAEQVVRYGISMADIPLTTGQPD